jgi:3alpha(or 20beta)-hydroxysteroid dehydrogenase
MRARGGGSIVNVGSRASAIGIPGSGAYSAAKFGVRGITRTAALENAEHGIRVNMIYPGLVHTPIFDETPVSVDLDEILARERWFMGVGVPMGRRGKPSEVSPLVVFLASDESSYVTGVEIPVDGGMLAGATASGIHEIRGTGGALDEAMAT